MAQIRMSRKADDRASGGPPPDPAAPAGAEARGAAPGPSPAFPGRDWAFGLLLLVATLLAYAPAWHAGFIWDDNGHVTRPDLRSLHGLWRIWAEPGATQQYYPFLHSAFWLEHRLWGDSPLGYHLANIAMHAAAAFLLFRVLRALALPGAWLGASAFALHPVCVESVAWVSEQKNTLSAVFYMAAALAYLRFDRGRRAPWYALATALFLLALATKTVTATLPAALLVVVWWKRGRLSWRADALPLLPWLLMGAAAGVLTAWVERNLIGATGTPYGLGPAARFLLAGRALWFYLGKVAWPARLTFVYPRWTVDAGAAWQYLYPAAAAAALAGLFWLRRRSRGPLAAALLYAGTLLPALGFVDVFPFVYSYVADHFQYVAAAAAISAGAAALTSAAARLPGSWRPVAAAAGASALAALAFLTWRQCSAYADAETLWRTTIARNPRCWMAYENLGGVLMEAGRLDEAADQFRRALEAKPDDDGAMNELGVALLQEGRSEEAIAQFRRALLVAPRRAETHINIGVALLGAGRPDEAAAHLATALEIEPGNAKAHKNLALAFMRRSQWHGAAEQLARAAEAEPGNAETLNNLGLALVRDGRPGPAISQFRRAVEISPGFAEAHANLATQLALEGAVDEAAAHFQRAAELDPGNADAHFNLGNALLQLGRADQAIAQFRRAVEIRPEFAHAHDNLAHALLEAGRADEAAEQLRAALALEPGDAQVHNELGVVLFRQGRSGEAAAQYRRAIEIKPDFAVALVNLANLLLQDGHAGQAAETYARALDIEPNDARVHNNLGIALLKDGRRDEAEAQFRRALEIEPGYEDARRNLSVLARSAGGP